MFSSLLCTEVQCVNASYKFWSVGKENPLFLVMVELVRFRRKRVQFGQFSPARTVFLYLFSAALRSISDIVLFASFDFCLLFCHRFFFVFSQPLAVESPTSFFFIFVSLLLASHSFRFDDLWLTLLL